VTIDLLLEQHRDLLKEGTMLIDPTDNSEEVRVLFYLEHTIQDASTDSTGKRREVSRQLQFIELDDTGTIHQAGYAPFLDYRPLHAEEQPLVPQLRSASWLNGDLEEQARSYAITELVPRHLEEVRHRREEQIDKTSAAVNERLTTEISYWDNRAAILQAQEAAGKPNARLNSQMARQRAGDLLDRLYRRLNELEQERKLSPLPPVVVGGVLVVPQGLIDKLTGGLDALAIDQFAHETAHIERIAMAAVMQAERELGYIPRDVSFDKCGYDIESSIPGTGKLRFIEVKGRIKGADTVTVTKNEVLTALNKPDDFILAIVEVDGDDATTHYVARPFQREPDFGVTSVNYDLARLLTKGVIPV
jgi:Protein NO VEIN, C-terminal